MSRDDLIEWSSYGSVSYELVQRWAAFGDPARILDLGCGAGRNSVFFANLGFDVTGLDIDEKPLNIARNIARSKNLKIDYRNGDMLNIPYPDNYFDAVYADNILSLTNYSGVKRALSEINRVLRPGGEAFMEFLKHDHGYKSMCRKIDDHTYISRAQYGKHIVAATFFDKSDIKELLRDFDVLDDSGMIHGYAPYPDLFLILAAKRSGRIK